MGISLFFLCSWARKAAEAGESARQAVPPPAPLHVGDLGGAMVPSARRWKALVTVRVDDARHAPVPGAAVSGSWSSGGTSSSTTDAAGLCTLSSGALKKSVTFRVDTVSGAGFAYEPGANHDPDGDSDGTSLFVPRP